MYVHALGRPGFLDLKPAEARCIGVEAFNRSVQARTGPKLERIGVLESCTVSLLLVLILESESESESESDAICTHAWFIRPRDAPCGDTLF